jgi:hypothetical protein
MLPKRRSTVPVEKRHNPTRSAAVDCKPLVPPVINLYGKPCPRSPDARGGALSAVARFPTVPLHAGGLGDEADPIRRLVEIALASEGRGPPRGG